MRRLAALALGALAIGGCAARAPAGTAPAPMPGAGGAGVSGLADPGSVYRVMGFLVSGPPLPFVASVHYLADVTSDSALAVLAVSLANRALTFQRDGNEFVAQYHVEIAFRSDTGTVRQFATDEAVRVPSLRETQRSDESVIYQRFFGVPPGIYTVSLTVRDRSSPAVSHQERTDTVPRFAEPALTTPVAVYQGPGRRRRADVPQLLLNPRATLPFGADSLRFYVEAYGLAPGTRLLARALDPGGHEIWHDTVALAGSESLVSGLVVLGPGELPVGEGRLEVTPAAGAPGGLAARAAPFLVSFSDQFVITNYDQLISLLRYFERQDWVEKLRQAPPDQRPLVWREFYKATNPDPTKPENEALERYFQRLQVASQRFQEAGEPGWLTDRGQVFITLGEPDDVFDFGADAARAGVRGIRWTYNALRLTLFFQDQTGFGRFRLTPLSRVEFQRALVRLRRTQ